MRFLGSFARLSVVVVVALALVVVFASALASTFFLPSGGLAPQIAAEELPSTSSSPATTAAAPAQTAATPSSASASTSMATVSCQRRPGQPTADEPYLLRVGETEPGVDPIAVAVDLVRADGVAERRTVESAVLAADGSLDIEVPQSAGVDYVDCLVVAIQRGDRVVYTGN